MPDHISQKNERDKLSKENMKSSIIGRKFSTNYSSSNFNTLIYPENSEANRKIFSEKEKQAKIETNSGKEFETIAPSWLRTNKDDTKKIRTESSQSSSSNALDHTPPFSKTPHDMPRIDPLGSANVTVLRNHTAHLNCRVVNIANYTVRIKL